MPDAKDLLAAPAVALLTDGILIARPSTTPGAVPTPLATLVGGLPAVLAGQTAATLAAGNDPRIPDVVSGSTTGSTPVTLTGLRAPSEVAGALRVKGHVMAQNPVTGDVAMWDVTAAMKVVAGVASLVGAPSVTQFAADPALTGCQLSAAPTQSGLALQATGLAGLSLAWTGAFLSTAA